MGNHFGGRDRDLPRAIRQRSLARQSEHEPGGELIARARRVDHLRNRLSLLDMHLPAGSATTQPFSDRVITQGRATREPLRAPERKLSTSNSALASSSLANRMSISSFIS
jgi:hypothetical protein